jgi:hypothetical protein
MQMGVKMAKEARSHGFGHEPEEPGLKQHQHMARDGKVMPGGDFGVSVYPGRRRIEHPEGEPESQGRMLDDHERANPPNIMLRPHMMHATAHSHHGMHNFKGAGAEQHEAPKMPSTKRAG